MAWKGCRGSVHDYATDRLGDVMGLVGDEIRQQR